MQKFLKSTANLVILFILIFGSVGQASAAPKVIFVKWNAGGSNNGSSWTNAYLSLQTALAAAVSGDEIWVAAGTYKPTTDTNRTISFALKNGVGVYGGFNGTETLRLQRYPPFNLTTLSGDIGSPHDWSDNSFHIIRASGLDSTAVLDGFTIFAGNANGDGETALGGGMLNSDSSPTLTELIFDNNWAKTGGGMHNTTSNPTLTNVRFSNNKASYVGGGMYNYASNLSLLNVTFYTNSVTPADTSHGGGMYNYTSDATLTDVSFFSNTASGLGGGMLNYESSPNLVRVTFSANTSGTGGGGMMNWNASSPSLTNVTFNANSSTGHGGAMYNYADSMPFLENVTFSGNTSGGDGGAMFNYGNGIPEIHNSIFWGNGSEISNNASAAAEIYDSIVQGGCPADSAACANIINANPILGVLQHNGGLTQTMALGLGSPAVDAGNNAYCAATDQRGVARPWGAKCDMGAYELIYYRLSLPLILR
jgi:hypothetical protein